MKIAVLGAGAWGTALARLLASDENHVILWGHNAAALAQVRRTGRNDRFLPGIDLPTNIEIQDQIDDALAGAECTVIAVPSKAFREVSSRLRDFKGLVVSVTKGIEYETGLTMCGVLRETAPLAATAALSGPTFAIEVAKDTPTAIVAASGDANTAERVQLLFTRPAFRVYTSTDLIGVELSGALKNVIAIAAGIGDGLGYGDNTKAALVTRSIVEIRRVGATSGARAETFTGLSGLGDLIVTCFSRHSRNRAFGERIGRGEKAADIAKSMESVAEGYPTSRSAFKLARKNSAVTPVLDEVYSMLYENKDIRSAVQDLMSRELKPEA
jgi:glycerol-3-phosphate dehydrogenase (NAD(P)+)